MRGYNQVWLSGNIGGKIVKSQTKDNRTACSFAIASEGGKRRTTWVRINVYDRLAEYCKDRLEKGVYCSVVGELMNRDGQYGELTEVRAHDIIFFNADHSVHGRSENADDEDLEYGDLESAE